MSSRKTGSFTDSDFSSGTYTYMYLNGNMSSKRVSDVSMAEVITSGTDYIVTARFVYDRTCYVWKMKVNNNYWVNDTKGYDYEQTFTLDEIAVGVYRDVEIGYTLTKDYTEYNSGQGKNVHYNESGQLFFVVGESPTYVSTGTYTITTSAVNGTFRAFNGSIGSYVYRLMSDVGRSDGNIGALLLGIYGCRWNSYSN